MFREQFAGGSDLRSLPESSPRAKIGFKDRHWSDIDKLWRTRAKEAPSVEHLLKPQANFSSKKTHTKSYTLPAASGSPATTSRIPTTSQGSVPVAIRSAIPTFTMAIIDNSSATTCKAIGLMSPTILDNWREKGSPIPENHYIPMRTSKQEHNSSTVGENQYFADLLNAW